MIVGMALQLLKNKLRVTPLPKSDVGILRSARSSIFYDEYILNPVPNLGEENVEEVLKIGF